MSASRAALAPLGLYAALALALAGSTSWGGSVPWYHDLAHQHYPWRAWAARTWASGELPLWAPVGWGFPLLGDGQAGILYPPNIVLYALLSEPLAFSWSITLHLVFAGMGGWALGRTLRCSAAASVLLGLTWSWSGLSLSHVDYLGMFEVLAWFPWLVAGAVSGALGGGWRRWALTGLGTGVAFLAGHPQAALIATYASVGAALWVGRERLGQTLRGLVALGVVAAGIAGPQLVASADLAAFGLRAGGVDEAFAEVGALPAEEVVNLVFPAPFGRDRPVDMERVSAHRAAYQGRGVAWWEDCFFVGAPVVLLALAAGRQVPLWSAGLGALLWMLGTPVYGLVRLLPGMEWFRFPVRASMILVLVLAVLAARGLDRVVARPPGRAPRRIGLAVGAVALVACVGTAALRLGEGHLVAALGARMVREVTPEDVAVPTSRGLPPPASRSPAEALGKARGLVAELEADVAPYSPRVAVPLGMVLLFALALGRRQLRPLAVVSVVGLDLVTTGWPLVQAASPAVLDAPPAASALGAGARVGVLGRRVASSLDGRLLSANLGLLWGAEDVIVPSPLRTSRSERMAWLLGLDLTDEPVADKARRLADHRRWLDAAGVEVITTTEPFALEGFTLAVDDAPVRAYRNVRAGPPAFLVGCTVSASGPTDAEQALVAIAEPAGTAVVEGAGLDTCVPGPAGEARVRREGGARWVIDVDADRPAWLVLVQAIGPGQEWRVDGAQVDGAPTDLAFQGVPVPAGRHEVVFEVRGGRVRAALGVSAVTLLGVVGALALGRRA